MPFICVLVFLNQKTKKIYFPKMSPRAGVEKREIVLNLFKKEERQLKIVETVGLSTRTFLYNVVCARIEGFS